MPEDPGEGPALRVGDALRWAARLLAGAGLESPRLEAELLLGHVLGTGRAGLLVRRDEPLTPEDAARITDLVRRRAAREPAAYLLGRRPFYDLDLYVAPGVLVPRPETEGLVDEALAWCRAPGHPCRLIADVGTGSGALAVTLAHHLPEAHVVAVDVSPRALAVARRNATRYDLEDRVSLLCGDLLGAVAARFDLVVANLPYVPGPRLPTLAPEVRVHEPRLALDGGPEGLAVLERFVPQLAERLGRPGLAVLEIDEGQGGRVSALVRRWLPDAEVRVLQDLAGLDRIVRAECGERAERIECAQRKARGGRAEMEG